MMSPADPLGLAGLEPDVLEAQIKARDVKPKDPEQLKMQQQKEQRLSDKEKRLGGGKVGAAALMTPPDAPAASTSANFLFGLIVIKKLLSWRRRGFSPSDFGSVYTMPLGPSTFACARTIALLG